MIGGIPPMVNNSVKEKHLFSQTSASMKTNQLL